MKIRTMRCKIDNSMIVITSATVGSVIMMKTKAMIIIIKTTDKMVMMMIKKYK